MNNEYDIRSIFEEMELELIRSMRRNLTKHQKWEEDEGINWTMWQAEQLKSFDKFKKENEKIFGKRFATVNEEIREFLEHTYVTAGLDQEKEILNALANNKKIKEKTKKGLEGSFFNLNKKKMMALIDSTTSDLSKAEHAMLRLTNDQYRKIIYKAEVMFNTGAFNLKQSIDAASKDFLKAGINCVEYKDGRRVNIASYAEMCLRTSNKRAKFVAEGDVRKEYGIHTVKISRYGGCSEMCLPWQGKVYVDDVWSGGTKEEAEEKKLPLLSTAIEGGLMHPNCKHSMFTYYYDRKKAYGQLEQDGVEVPKDEQEHRRNHLHIQQQKRLEEGSLDPQNIQEAKFKKEQWIEKQKSVEQRQKIRRNYGKDLAQYERYKQVLGEENLPKTFEDFRQLKYNDVEKYGLLKDYRKSRSSNMISSFTSFDQYVEYKKRIDTEIIGIITSDGLVIKSQSKHFIERVFGTTEDPKTKRPREGVSLEEIIDTLKNGKVRKRVDSWRYIKDKCSVSVNQETGNLIQVNKVEEGR